MIEKFRENFHERKPESVGEVKKFDPEREKKYRQEIRKTLTGRLSDALKDFGFKKMGHSLWSRKVRDSWHIVYLQRSQFSHQYYVEAGICKKKDIPKGEKPVIVFCKERKRIEGIVESIEKERTQREENAEEVIRQKVNDIKVALDFELPGAQKEYPGEYFIPSVSPEESENKIGEIQKAVGEYVPLWFDAKSST